MLYFHSRRSLSIFNIFQFFPSLSSDLLHHHYTLPNCRNVLHSNVSVKIQLNSLLSQLLFSCLLTELTKEYLAEELTKEHKSLRKQGEFQI